MATISQRISLEGSEDIRKQLEQLGVAGEAAFKQIQEAAKKPITDPGQIEKTKQAFDNLAATTTKLGPQFQALADSAKQFGTEGERAGNQVAAGLNKTNAAAAQASTSLQQISAGSNAATIGIVALGSALGTVLAGALSKVKGLVDSFSFAELTKGAVETANELQGQADKVGLSIEQWLQLRRALQSTSMSWEDAASGLAKLGQTIDQSLIAKFRDVTVQTENGAATIRIINGVIGNTATISGKAAAALRELGVSSSTLVSGDKLAIMREVAVAIDKIPNAAERADRGLRVFGRNWEELIKSLIASKNALEANRDLMPEQVAQLKKLGAAWDTLGTAVRAVKDQIGLLFAGPATARAEWLTTLADGVRKLVIDFSKLSEEKQKLFLGQLGGSPAETAFKILIALGQQLAGIWRDVLVPAGAKLMEVVTDIAGSFKGVTGSQVAAFFITAAIAAAGLALALKGIALVLSPIATLISVAFSPLGLILIGLGAVVVAFWDKFKEAAKTALALIPEELGQMKTAFQQLFRGDFAGFWNQFSTAAVSAFAKIKEAFLQTDIGKTVAESIRTIIDALGGVGTAATAVAATLTLVFGRRITVAAAGAVLAFGQFTGALGLLKNVVGIIAPIITTFAVVLGTLITSFGLIPVAIGAAVIAIGALLYSLNPEAWKAAAQAVMEFFKALATGDVEGATKALNTLGAIIKKEVFGIGKDAGGEFGKGFGEKLVELAVTIGKTFGEAVFKQIKEALTPTDTGEGMLQSIADAIMRDLEKFEKSLIENARRAVEKIKGAFSIGQAQAAETGPGAQTQTTQEMDKVATSAQLARDAIAAIATSLSNLDFSKFSAITQIDWSALTQGATSAAQSVVDVWIGVAQSFTNLGQMLAGAFDWSGVVQGATSAAQSVVDVWIGVAQSFTNLGQMLATAFSWEAIVQGASSAANVVVQAWGTVGQAFNSVGQEIAQAISGAMQAALASVTSAVQSIVQEIDRARQKLQQLKADAASAGGAEGLPFARGGYVYGRGTGTSDSIAAWLSRGEYVIPAHAVRQPGMLALLEALRRTGGNLRGVLDDMGHYARGGLVLPAFASGGLNRGSASSASRVLNLTIGTETFRNLSVPEATAQSLERFAVHSQIASTGRRPSWKR